MLRKTLIGLVAGVSLFAGVAMAQNDSERFILPKRFQNFTIYGQGIMNVRIKYEGKKYHVHVFDIDRDNKADVGFFYPFGAEKNLEDHREPLYHAFDLDGSNSFSLDELFVRRVLPSGKVKYFRAKIEPKLKAA